MRNAVLIFLVVVILTSCSKEDSVDKRNDTEQTVGRYIYRDDNDIHHINPNCFKLRHGKDDAGHEIYAKHLMDTSEFFIGEQDYFRVCSRCVGDKTYEHIIAVSRRNSLRNEARRWLYDKLVEANYDMPDYETYDNRLEDVEVRSRLYRIAQDENWNVGTSERDFSKRLGF